MIEEFLQDRAIRYVCGAMSPEERDDFEVLLLFQDELRQLADQLQEVASGLAISRSPAAMAPRPELKSRVLAEIANQPLRGESLALVITGADRLVLWVNPQFTAICGYGLDELQGKNLGPILQGEQTDPAAIARMREALRREQPVQETVVNYHKDGSPYRVAIAITPLRDDQDRLRWFLARERLEESVPA